jgi:hypothetical protein
MQVLRESHKLFDPGAVPGPAPNGM